MKILIVDDEAPILELVRYNLEKEGYGTVTAENGTEALRLARSENPSLVILDLMLPDMSGLDVCRVLKNDTKTMAVPIIIVTAKTEDADIVAGLELGADDYVTKPFSPKVLIARIKSVLRRMENAGRQTSLTSDEIVVHGIKINPLKHEASVADVPVDFSATEFAILIFLAQHPGQVFSRQQIINAIKGESYPVTDRAVDVQILGIRRKLDAAGAGDAIETIRGVGYRMCEDETEE
ncbi:MAG: response regulator transcription factor [Treponema sp.]|nr:response regulator transcription factor [Treponema sp.]